MKVLLAAHSTFSARSEFENFFDFLCRKPEVSVTSLAHPLLKGQAKRQSETRRWDNDELSVVNKSRYLSPPLSFAVDRFRSQLSAKFDVAIGFNPLQTISIRKLLSENGVLVNWSIDFVPEKHYPMLLRNFYAMLDRQMMKSVDLIIENNELAANARSTRAGQMAERLMIVPITINDYWLMGGSNQQRRRKTVAYTGTMNDRNGVRFLIDVAERVLSSDEEISFTFIGDGPLLPELQSRIVALGYEQRVEIMGYVDDEQIVLRKLQEASLALAPYARDPSSFTQFADPQKLKWYAAAGLPMIVSPEPPSAKSLEQCGAAVLLSAQGPDDMRTWADVIIRLLNDEKRQEEMRRSSSQWALQFSRNDQYRRVWQEIRAIHAGQRDSAT